MPYSHIPPPIAGYGYVTSAAAHGNANAPPRPLSDKLYSFVRGATVGKFVNEALVFVAGKVISGDLNFNFAETSFDEIFKDL